ncbi:MAG: hypothetical protein Q9207_004953 [Kuettlingeria erythrocarpa]
MADILFGDDDDDDFWIEDPYTEADDLAEHTMHSPVLVNYDPAFESNDVLTDWDDYSDDYFDFESSNSKRRKVEKATSPSKKRRIPKSIKSLPELSLGDSVSSDEEINARARSIVVWKATEDSRPLPVLKDGQEEKVSILKDWKERFKPPPRNSEVKPAWADGSQRAIAVVIQQKSLADRTVNGAGTALSVDSKQKRRHGLRDNPGPDHAYPEGIHPSHTNGLAQENSKRAKPSFPGPRGPVPPIREVATAKRKLQNDEAEKPAPAKKTRARREDLEKPEHNGSDHVVNGTAASASIQGTDKRGQAERLGRKRKLSPTNNGPESELVSKKKKPKPSHSEATSQAKPAAAPAVGRRSTRRK